MNFNEFETRADAAIAAGKRITSALHRRLETDESAAIVVSGGSTPAPVYSYMAHKELDWHRVHVLLSDERWVAADHPDSNENMLRTALERSRAAYAQIVPFVDLTKSIEKRCSELNDEIGSLPLPFTSVLLGMGDDGHFASLFPDANESAAGAGSAVAGFICASCDCQQSLSATQHDAGCAAAQRRNPASYIRG